METPKEFKQFMEMLRNSDLSQAYYDYQTPLEFFLDVWSDNAAAAKQLEAYFTYILSHPDREDKSSALWRELDRHGKFRGVKKELKFFEECQRELRQRLGLHPVG